MPILLEPNQLFPIVLDSDIDKPIESRPTFYAKAVSMRGLPAVSQEMDALFEGVKTTDEMSDRAIAMFYRYVLDFKNMGSHKYGDDLKEFMVHREVMEVLRKVMTNQHVQQSEKKS